MEIKQMICGADGKLSIRRVMAAVLFGFILYFLQDIDVNNVSNDTIQLLVTLLGGVFSLLGLVTGQNIYDRRNG